MPSNRTLILVPTPREMQLLEALLPADVPRQICGFGPVAAGIETTRFLNTRPYCDVRHVILVGIAGTRDSNRFPVGSAASFRGVCCYGIGAGSGRQFSSPLQLGIPQVQLDHDRACYDQLPLQSLASGPVGDGLLTVCSAAASRAEAEQRFQRFPDCVCEDMEGFAVALAATRAGVSVSVVRGVSNITGDRDHDHWVIGPALAAAAELVRAAVT